MDPNLWNENSFQIFYKNILQSIWPTLKILFNCHNPKRITLQDKTVKSSYKTAH